MLELWVISLYRIFGPTPPRPAPPIIFVHIILGHILCHGAAAGPAYSSRGALSPSMS